MKTITKLLVLVSFLNVSFSEAQDCDCKSNFNWLKKAFEENEAGFWYAVEIKGKLAYEKHNQVLKIRAQNIKDRLSCLQVLNEVY